MKWLTLGFLLVVAAPSWALVAEGTLAASSTQYDDAEIPATSGVTARLRFRHYGAQDDSTGFFYGGDFPGVSVLGGSLYVGYGYSTRGPWAWEFGGGVFRSPIFGSGVTLVVGLSHDITPRLAISLPAFYNVGFYIQATPTLAWRF